MCVCVNTEALSVLPRNSDCSFQSGTLGFLKEACTSSGCHNKISLIVWLKQQELISHNSGGRKSLVKGPPAEGPWRRFCLARRWSPFRCVLAWEVSALLPPLIRAPRCFPEARLSPDTVTLGVRAPTQECRGGTGQPLAFCSGPQHSCPSHTQNTLVLPQQPLEPEPRIPSTNQSLIWVSVT